MSKLTRVLLTKVVAVLIVGVMAAITLVALFTPNDVVLAQIFQPPTNVAYFEGYGGNLDSQTIHNRTRLPIYVTDAPSVTVFVHGQKGDASHWSNDGNGNFAYDPESLIERLRADAGGANVYWARMSKDTLLKQ